MKRMSLAFSLGFLITIFCTQLSASNFELRCGFVQFMPLCCTVDLTTGQAVHCIPF